MASCPPTRGALASSDVDDVRVKEAADEIVRAGWYWYWMLELWRDFIKSRRGLGFPSPNYLNIARYFSRSAPESSWYHSGAMAFSIQPMVSQSFFEPLSEAASGFQVRIEQISQTPSDHVVVRIDIWVFYTLTIALHDDLSDWKGRRIDDLSRGLRSLTKDSHGPEWSESSN